MIIEIKPYKGWVKFKNRIKMLFRTKKQREADEARYIELITPLVVRHLKETKLLNDK